MCLPAVPEGTPSRRTFLLRQEAPAGDTGTPTPGGGYWDYGQRDEEDEEDSAVSETSHRSLGIIRTVHNLKILAFF